jgi:PEP-CTERM motif
MTQRLKLVSALLVALLLTPALPALADSVPIPPVTSVSFSGVTVTGFFNSPTSYYLDGTNTFQNNWCTADCTLFEVEKGVFTGRSTTNFAYVYGFANAGSMFGHLGRVSFNSQTDVLSGVFGGKEAVRGANNVYSWYTVKGAFSENLVTGNGTVNLTSETYIGTTSVPEPETLTTLGTGLCAIAGVALRKLRSMGQLCKTLT